MLRKIVVYIFYAIILSAFFLHVSSSQLVHATVFIACFLSFCIYQAILCHNKALLPPIPGIMPALLFLFFILIQIIPIPSGWLVLLAPSSAKIYTQTIWLIDPDMWMPISVNQRSSLQGFFQMSSLFVFYLLGCQILNNQRRAVKSLNCLTWVAFAALCAIAINKFLTVEIPFLSFDKSLLLGLAARINDHAVITILLLAPMLFAGYIISTQKRSNFRKRPIEGRAGRCETFFTSLQVSLGKACFITTITLIAISGELVLYLLALVSILSWVATSKINRSDKYVSIKAIGVLLFLAMAGLCLYNSDINSLYFLHRDQPADLGTNMHIINRAPISTEDISLLGTGFGTFFEVSTFLENEHRSADVILTTPWSMMIETGIVGLSLILWFFIEFARKFCVGIGKQRDKYSISIVTGAVASLQVWLFIVIANPQELYVAPGVFISLALSFAVALSMNTKAALLSKDWSNGRLGSVGLLLTCCLYYGGELYAESITSPTAHKEKEEQNEVGNVEAINDDAFRLRTAITLAPLNTGCRQEFISKSLDRLSPEELIEESKNMLRHKPLNEEGLLLAGMLYDILGDFGRAEQLMLASSKTRAVNVPTHMQRVNWLLSKGLKEKAIRYTYYVLKNQPEMTREYLAMLGIYEVSEEEKRVAIPDRAQAYWIYATLADINNYPNIAEAYYMDAVRMTATDWRPDPKIFFSAIEHFTKKDKIRDALNIALKGQENFPRNHRLTFLAAQLYERTGITYRALEEYRKTLLLDPGNTMVEKKIVLLQQ